jgi:hypothetical protein
MANTATINTRQMGITWTTGTSYSITIGPGFVREVGNNRSNSPGETSTQTNALNFTTYASSPILTSTTPTNNSTGTFNENIKLTFDRLIFAESGKNFYIYKDGSPDTLFQTIPISSSSVSISSNTCTISLTGFTWTDGIHYITTDPEILSDPFNFKYVGMLDDTVLKFEQSVISNMPNNRTYRGNSGTFIFSSMTPQIIDIDVSTSTQYTINFTSTMGDFSTSTNGTDASKNWSFTGTKSQCNAKFSTLIFYPDNNISSGSFIYTQTKRGITQIQKTVSLTTSETRTYPENTYTFNTVGNNFTWTPDYESVKYSKAFILILGGGGGGDSVYGGGGGGGVVELLNQTLEARNYSFTIGAGGAGGIYEPKTTGISGNPPTYTETPYAYAQNGTSSIFDGTTAYGGEGAGWPGQPYNASTYGNGANSGQPTYHIGGIGSPTNYSGGGGGAGGAGSGATGGTGTYSIAYGRNVGGGGGGAGHSNANLGGLGSDGGGRGFRSGSFTGPTNGGTGGGGGGGGGDRGGNGGGGMVHIGLSPY